MRTEQFYVEGGQEASNLRGEGAEQWVVLLQAVQQLAQAVHAQLERLTSFAVSNSLKSR